MSKSDPMPSFRMIQAHSHRPQSHRGSAAPAVFTARLGRRIALQSTAQRQVNASNAPWELMHHSRLCITKLEEPFVAVRWFLANDRLPTENGSRHDLFPVKSRRLDPVQAPAIARLRFSKSRKLCSNGSSEPHCKKSIRCPAHSRESVSQNASKLSV